MSDLIKFLRDVAGDSMGMEPGDRQLIAEAADEIERLLDNERILMNRIKGREAEIERLECALAISRGKHENAIAWNAKLQAVVDAAKRSRETDEYGLLSVEKGWELDRALAALEVDDD